MRSNVRRSLLLVAVVSAFGATARAFPDDGAAPTPPAPAATPDPLKAVRDAWDARQAAMKDAQAAAADRAKAREAGAAFAKASAEFVRLFTACDWNLVDPAKDGDMLRVGLSSVGRQAYMQDDDMKTARRVYDAYAKAFPDKLAALGYTQADLATADGDFAAARALLDKDLAGTNDKIKPSAHVSIGDILAAQGDVAGAQKEWQAAVAAVPADADPRKDREMTSAKSGAEARLALVGKPAPEVDTKTWVGGDAKPLSALKGSVVVADFWATWCIWCRKAMPGLSKMYDERKKDGLVVLGVTHVFPQGFLPKPGTKDPMHDGESMKVKAEDYTAHLEQFKANLAISYPFVVATEAEPKAYHLAGWPTLAVIDRASAVAFYAVGVDPAGDALIKATIERLLKTPAK